MRNARCSQLLAAGLIILGCGARAYHYFLSPSLNHDDAALALNVIQRGVRDLRGALDYVQLAPWGFLLLERTVVSTIGASELALRLIPFIASVASVPAFWFLASRRLHSAEAVLATGFFTMSQDLTGASLQVKQYSTEILIAILLFTTSRALFIEDGGLKRRDWIVAAIAGAVAVWFSFSSVFVLAPDWRRSVAMEDLPCWPAPPTRVRPRSSPAHRH